MIKCIAIDDEPLALKQMETYISKTPYLDLVAACQDAFEAIEVLNKNDVELMFVDINMPDLNGMEFVKSLDKPPKVIFTTAYAEYAIEGFKVDAVDYILKPIGYSDFLKASDKAKERILLEKEGEELESNEEFLFVKSEYKIIRINFDNIEYVEGMREYVQIHLTNGRPIMTLLSMKKLMEQLPVKKFMRVHRSFIVNLEKLTTIERNRILFGEKVRIPVSEQYKDEFHRYIDENFL